MKKMTIEENDDISAAKPCPSAELSQFHRALRVLAGKWKGEIIWRLVQRKHRFGELRQSIPGVTQHMLTTQLRDLEADGLVKRTVYPEVPPRVEYEITPSAKALRPVFDELFRWSQEHGFPTGRSDGGGADPEEPAGGGPREGQNKLA
jgi:DNA-binding HxlR family transcriptional regulator